jgi:hypothetical protein
MRIEVDDPALVPDLLAFLREHPYVIAEQVGPRELEVSQLGSGNAAARRLELDLLLQAWRAARGGERVQIID